MDLLENAFDAFEDDGVFDGIREEAQAEQEEDDEVSYYKEENHLLKKEVKELRKTLRLFTQQPDLRVKNIAEDGPVAQLVLFNKPSANELAEELREVIMDTVHKFQTSQDDYLNKAQSSAIQYPANNNKHENKKTPKEEKKCNKVYTATHAFQFFKTDNFYLDQLGASYFDPDSVKFGVQYACLDALNGEIEELSTESGKPKTVRPDKTCWNCGNAGHQLPECPEPRNQQKINLARNTFMERSQQFGNGSRYCNDENDNDVRFAKFQPGQISDELREAMGLKPQQLPLHIYRMRKYGYPPGHLLDAVMTSGLNFYKTSYDHQVSTQNENLEEQTDVSKLIPYPGFNIDMTTPYIEECHQLGFPQMNSYGLVAMKEFYTQQNDVIKSKLKKTTTDMEEEEKRKCDLVASKNVAQTIPIVKDDDTNPVDMELSDNEPSDWQVLDETSQSVTSLSPCDNNEERSAPSKEQPETYQMEQQIETTDEKMDDQQSSTNVQETTEKSPQEQKQLSPEEGEIDDGVTIETETHYIVDETGVNCADLTEEELAMRRELLNEIKEAEEAAPVTTTTTDDKEHSQKEDGTPASANNEGENVGNMEESPAAEVGSTPMKSGETAPSDGNAEGGATFKTPSASPFSEGVPHRSSFAKGITPFTYDDVTPSKGIYLKLKTLLKK